MTLQDLRTAQGRIAYLDREVETGGAITSNEHDASLAQLERAVAADRFTFVSAVLMVRGQKPAR